MAEKIFRETFCEITKIKVCTTTAEMNFDNYTEPGAYEIYEDMGNGKARLYLLTVDRSASGDCMTQTRMYCGKIEYRQADGSGKWDAWKGINAAEETGNLRSGGGVDSLVQNATTGVKPTASGTGAAAFGNATVADKDFAHAEGWYTEASGKASHAEGYRSKATNNYAHGEGYLTTASGGSSHAEGENTQASGERAHAEGYKAKATGNASHGEGCDTEASGAYSHAEGQKTKATGTASHAEGANCEASANYAHAEGANTKATGNASHAEGDYCRAMGAKAHAEGAATKAYSEASHAEGYESAVAFPKESNGAYVVDEEASAGMVAKGAHAEGWKTFASANGAHSEGNQTVALGIGSHAEGGYTVAREKYSHAGGVCTIASAIGQHVCGKYNIPSETALYIVGCGTDENNRKNAFMVDVDADGNPIYDFGGARFTPAMMEKLAAMLAE